MTVPAVCGQATAPPFGYISAMSRLLLYHDFTSPFCRLAASIVSEAASRTGLELRPVPFELHPAPVPLPGPDELPDDEMATARQAAEDWGLELGRLARVPRTRKAHEALAHARENGEGEAVLLRLYDALWTRDLDIARLDVLADEVEAAGLDREEMHLALGLDHFEDEVVREQEAAEAAGITGVPTVQVGEVVAVGLLPVDELIEWLEANR